MVAAVDADPAIRQLLSVFPQVVVILNEHRQIIAGNRGLLQLLGAEDPAELIGQRMGEALSCVHAEDMPAGCGTAEACQFCGAVNAMLACQREQRQICDECRLSLRGVHGTRALELRVQVSPLQFGDQELYILAATDFSASRRREALERTFFHDVLNIAGGIQSLSQMLADGNPTAAPRYAERIEHLTRQLVDQIRMQRDLAAAEDGRLRPIIRTTEVAAVLSTLRVAAEADPTAVDRHIAIDNRAPADATIETDPVLLQRVLLNLVRNALEASEIGGSVLIQARLADGQLALSVHNNGVMPRHVQLRVFQRSFSTKLGRGRGLGTFSAKMLTEDYLGGQIGFTSGAPDGTAFTVMLPRKADPSSPAPAPTVAGDALANKRVLLLSSDQPQKRTRSFQLRAAGALVSTARSPSEAVSTVLAANQTSQPFDVLIVDLATNDINSLEAVSALRRAGLGLPTLALIGESTDPATCSQAGCDATLAADAPAEALGAAIDRCAR